jgi:hypothetical protein
VGEVNGFLKMTGEGETDGTRDLLFLLGDDRPRTCMAFAESVVREPGDN